MRAVHPDDRPLVTLLGSASQQRAVIAAADLPEVVLQLLRSTVPTYPAVELLVFLARSPGRSWTPGDLVRESPLAHLPVEAARQYLAHFESAGLLRRDADGHRYAPASEEIRAAVSALVDAYDHRPVTLVRTVYSIAVARIQSFADSFRWKRDRE
jgi:hypothetical protein